MHLDISKPPMHAGALSNQSHLRKELLVSFCLYTWGHEVLDDVPVSKLTTWVIEILHHSKHCYFKNMLAKFIKKSFSKKSSQEYIFLIQVTLYYEYNLFQHKGNNNSNHSIQKIWSAMIKIKILAYKFIIQASL